MNQSVMSATPLQQLSSSHRLSVGWKLSQDIIPAVTGEFYAYPSDFTVGNPLYALMKCKSNKARVIGEAGQLGREANLFFQVAHARVCSVKMAHADGLLGVVDGQVFGENWVTQIMMTPGEFYDICGRRDPAILAGICEEACEGRKEFANLELNMVVAMMTDARKYGLFLVTELTPESIGIDACHVLLP